MGYFTRISSCHVGRAGTNIYCGRPLDGCRTTCITGLTALTVDYKWRLHEISRTVSTNYWSHFGQTIPI